MAINGSKLEESADLQTFQDEIKNCIADAGQWASRQSVNASTRWAVWANQHPDGRKHAGRNGDTPFPFDGANDHRFRLVDDIVNDDMRMMHLASKAAKIRCIATDTGDYLRAAKSTTLLEYVRNNRIPEIDREIRLHASYGLQCGLSIMSVNWQQETSIETKTLTVMDLQNLARQYPTIADQIGTFLSMLPNDDKETVTALTDILQNSGIVAEGVSRTHIRKMIKDLRETGQAEYDSPYVVHDRPVWQALKPFDDVFFPANARSLQTSRFVAERFWLTETELEEKAVSENWSDDFVSDAIAQKSRNSVYQWFNESRRKFPYLYDNIGYYDEAEDLIELFRFHYKRKDNDAGSPRTFEQVFNAFVSDVGAYDEPRPMEYNHGKYPYIPFIREHTEDEIIESRGIGEIAFTWQDSIKQQIDYRSDLVSMNIIPPFLVVPQRANTTFKVGPNAQIPVRRQGDIQPLQLPDYSASSKEVEETIKAEVNSYFGRYDPDNPDNQRRYQQDLVDNFLTSIRECYVQTFQLMQQFMSPIEVTLVVGQMPQPFRATRQEIQGQFDISVSYDVRDRDMEHLKQTSEFIMQTAPLAGQRVDIPGVIARLYEKFDPFIAEEYVRSTEGAAKIEDEETQNEIARAYAGIMPEMKDVNAPVNAQRRMQILQQYVQSNPEKLQENPKFAEMLEMMMKNYQQLLMQRQNAQTGRTGVSAEQAQEVAQ